MITDINGKLNLVTFQITAAAIFQEFYVQKDDVDIEEQKLHVIKTAARLKKKLPQLTCDYKWQLPHNRNRC